MRGTYGCGSGKGAIWSLSGPTFSIYCTYMMLGANTDCAHAGGGCMPLKLLPRVLNVYYYVCSFCGICTFS